MYVPVCCERGTVKDERRRVRERGAVKERRIDGESDNEREREKRGIVSKEGKREREGEKAGKMEMETLGEGEMERRIMKEKGRDSSERDGKGE